MTYEVARVQSWAPAPWSDEERVAPLGCSLPEPSADDAFSSPLPDALILARGSLGFGISHLQEECVFSCLSPAAGVTEL